MSLLKCENASFGYEDAVVVHDVSFNVERGDYLYIIGENGSGKSTLIKGILGLIKPHGGKVVYGDGLTKRGIGYLPQRTSVQRDFPASVYEVVMSGCLGRAGFHPFYTNDDRDRTCEAMTRLHVHDLAEKSFRDLSGGQQQRVLLARAICATDDLILLDEPDAGLDPIVTQELYFVIDELHKSGTSIIIVSHDLSALKQTATHVLHMKHSPLFFGTRGEYMESDVYADFKPTK